MVRVAFIGAGYMISEHLRVYAHCPDVKLVGIYSRTHARAQALADSYPGIYIACNIDDLYESCKPDLVIVAVPELACFEVCQASFKYPWCMLIEKPVGYHLEEAKEIEALADSFNSKVFVALNRRFYSSTILLKSKLLDLDSKRLVSVLDQQDPSVALESGQPQVVVDNWMYANSIHLIDYFFQFCRGELTNVNVLTSFFDYSSPVVAHIEFSSGDIGVYQAVWDAPGPWSVSVSTSKLRGEMRPLEQLTIQHVHSRQAVQQPADDFDLNYKPGLMRQALAAINVAKGLSSPLPTISDANKTMSLVSSIYDRITC